VKDDKTVVMKKSDAVADCRAKSGSEDSGTVKRAKTTLQ
jgi:hypothetical protein